MLAQDFHRHRALTGNSVRVIEGMNEGIALLIHQLLSVGKGFIVVVAMQHSLSTQRTHGIHFDVGRGLRHDNHAFDAELFSRQGHALGMISRRCANHATSTISLWQQANFVVSAAQLEGKHWL